MQSSSSQRSGHDKNWKFWVDRGGTFTDVIGIAPDGRMLTRKLLSQRADAAGDPAMDAIASMLRTDPATAQTQPAIAELRLGTTVATNALLERTGASTALLITRGFADALQIGYQNRPQLFAREIKLHRPLYDRVIECRERIGADGRTVEPLDENHLRAQLRQALEAGIESLAIVFLHAFAHPRHELRAAAIARSLGFSNVSVSHELNPVIKLVARGDTTVVDAYLNPVLRNYVSTVRANLRAQVPGHKLLFMQSNGGLTVADAFSGKDSVLSGPAGGVVGMVESAAAEGFSKVVGFDMGGTSTDVSVFAGDYERSEATEVAGVRLRAAMLKIHTVAAGGGSILHFSEGRMQAGPRSAGARPGPAAYGFGGPLTVTDCNVLLGRLQPDFFPQLFGREGDEPLQRDTVNEKFEELAAELARSGFRRSAIELALLFQDIAVHRMARAIKQAALIGGHDLSDFVLVAFGGAGPQHACQVANELGIRRILIHPLAGLLSALGIGLAPISIVREQTLRMPLDKAGVQVLGKTLQTLREAALTALRDRLQDDSAELAAELTVKLRYAGTDTALPVGFSEPAAMIRDFERAHESRFGFTSAGKKLVIESVMVLAQSPTRVRASAPDTEAGAHADASPELGIRPVIFAGEAVETPFYDRGKLALASTFEGPAIVIEDGATTVVEPGWRAQVTQTGQLLLTRDEAKSASCEAAAGTADVRSDPARLEVFNNLFMHVAEQMGAVLQNSARSVNIKERLDFSCAVFDGEGRLVANAPHMPVHLGSMGESVSTVIADNPVLRAGDVYLLNDPYRGGTHLPDLTVVAPVFLEKQEKPALYVAARGHHADIGGISPGSMPPASNTIDEEGILFSNFKLVSDGRFNEKELSSALTQSPYPARNPEQNIADLKAQVAACQRGIRLLKASAVKYGEAVMRAFLTHVQDNAEQAVRQVLARLESGSFDYPLDNGLRIRVAIRTDREARTATVDFSGSSPQHSGNFNAPFAVCRAAVLYVFRCLVDAPIPLNAGCLVPLKIVAPAGTIVNPRPPAAVVAGNVETSQAITNALFGALGTMAAAQGTMNNFTFGDDTHQYYETIAGGAGAGPGFHGADAVQTHMTNSRLTDPEVLELRFPVRVRAFAIRQDSGGHGQFFGGNGVIRDIEFLAPMHAAILSGHRSIPPFGLNGGGPGACGRNSLIAVGKPRIDLGASASLRVEAGDRIVIETPGGGGFGQVKSEH